MFSIERLVPCDPTSATDSATVRFSSGVCSHKWEIVTEIVMDRFGCASCVFENKIIVIGGGHVKGISERTSWDAFDIDEKQWASASGLVPPENFKLPRKEFYEGKALYLPVYY